MYAWKIVNHNMLYLKTELLLEKLFGAFEMGIAFGMHLKLPGLETAIY